nr:hypothetical protein [Gemmatimonadaceae bacterium]
MKPLLSCAAWVSRPCITGFVTLLAMPAALGAAVIPPALPDMPGTISPGLKLTLNSAADRASDSRTARLIALHVPSGSRVSPFLDPGPFTARWEGTITLRIRSEYTFRAVGS